MNLFEKILLATDGSQDAELAAKTAVELAKITGSELHVVSVAPGYPSYDVRVPEVVEELRRQAQNVLDEQLEKIEQAGEKVAQTHLRMAGEHPGVERHLSDEIVEAAEEVGAGLIVVGSRGRGGIRRALMGSASDAVVRHAHCPVMVVRGEPVVFPTKILVATDRSREAELAATTAADLAKSTNSAVHVVHVGLDQFRDEAQNELDTEVGMVREAGVTNVQAHLKFGIPAKTIVDLAEEEGIGLIVMGSRGRGGVRRALIGSVSSSVVPHAHCPVLVVRQEE
jgi:nucleotide-binding universal stress UspA family protein